MSPILPGATIGVLGSGQLGRMFAIAARRMGYRVATLSPDSDTPTGQVSDQEVVASFDDLDAVAAFAKSVAVVTFEFENVSSAATETAARFCPVRPAGAVLHTTQHRLREKTFLAGRGFPVAPFRRVVTASDLDGATYPAILKTAGFGYDGKGQTKVGSHDAAVQALAALDGAEAVLESFIDFEREISVVAARSVDGEFAAFAPTHNEHAHHILDIATAPSGAGPAVEQEAASITHGIMEALDCAGVLCVEFFLTRSGKLLVNEVAPRPHNSGHLTFDACVTSQFEQQLRAVCGLPLGSTAQMRPAAMVNLLGGIWAGGEPDWAAAARFRDAKLHLYGKLEARPGRKMGHITALAGDAAAARRIAIEARLALERR